MVSKENVVVNKFSNNKTFTNNFTKLYDKIFNSSCIRNIQTHVIELFTTCIHEVSMCMIATSEKIYINENVNVHNDPSIVKPK